MISAGVDGCKAGWIAVWGDGVADPEIAVFPDTKAVWEKFEDATLVLMDIPIGLSSKESRKCDLAARKLLGQPRGASVFPSPSREALSASSYTDACKINYEILGRKITKQCWGIIPKIREVDAFIGKTPAALKVIRESHPEICFWALNNGSSMRHRKRKKEGVRERLCVLEKKWPRTRELYAKALACYLRKHVARDDILDAIALYLHSSAPSTDHDAIPAVPQHDEKGLPMEMVYCRSGQLDRTNP